jgi:hypothetical protein
MREPNVNTDAIAITFVLMTVSVLWAIQAVVIQEL